MSWSPWVSCLTVSLAFGGAGCRRASAVQMTSESARPAAAELLPEETSVFDGRTVRLRGARGETLGLHVRLAGDDPGPAELDLPRGAAQVAAFAVRSLEVERPSTAM